MGSTESTLTLTRSRLTQFRYQGEQRFLLQLRGTIDGGRVVDGMGESRLSDHRGDRGGTAGWELLAQCLRRLDGRQLPAVDPASAAATVRALVAEFDALARAHARSADHAAHQRRLAAVRGLPRRKLAKRLVRRALRVLTSARLGRAPKPFQGTLLGLEVALVELFVNAWQRPAAELFGSRAAQLARGAAQLAGGAAQLAGGNLPGEADPVTYVQAYERALGRTVDQLELPPPASPTFEGQSANVYDEVSYLAPLGADGAKGSILEREALALGLTTTRFSKGAFMATDGVGPPLGFRWSRSPLSSAVSLGLCTHKEATRLRLQQAGLPVPKGRTFGPGEYPAAEEFAQLIGYPVVVKPAAGVRGIGVVANIGDRTELRRAFAQFERSRFGDSDFIVEQHIAGRDYRIVVIGDEVVAAIRREPASVEGDGEHTIAELIANKNAVRRRNPHLLSRLIKYDDAAKFQLAREGVTLACVLAPGRRVQLSDSCSLSQGGDSIDVRDQLHSSVREACIRTVRAIPGMQYCGVDFLMEDHTRPLDQQQAGICELNAHAAISNCEYPLYGQPRRVARPFIRRCITEFGLIANEKPSDQLALKLTVHGQVTRVGYRLWMQRLARSYGLTGWVSNTGDPDLVEAVLVGATGPVSALVAASIKGPRRARAISVTAEHIVPPAVDDFEIRGEGAYGA